MKVEKEKKNAYAFYLYGIGTIAKNDMSHPWDHIITEYTIHNTKNREQRIETVSKNRQRGESL